MFTLENTQGFDQTELNFHNEKFKRLNQDILQETNDLENLLQDLEEKYFNEYMC
jgi:hypothetical protein